MILQRGIYTIVKRNPSNEGLFFELKKNIYIFASKYSYVKIN